MKMKSIRVEKRLLKLLAAAGVAIAVAGSVIHFSGQPVFAETENTEAAVVRIDVTKNDGTTASTYYESWYLATEYLSEKNTARYEFSSWSSVKLVLLKDAEVSRDAEQWGGEYLDHVPVTICSENGTHTLTGSGYTTIIECGNNDITMQDIEIEGGFIDVSDAKLTLERGVRVSGRPYKGAASNSTIKISYGELILNDAMVSATSAAADGFYAVNLYDSTLHMNGYVTRLESVYSDGVTSTVVIDAFAADAGAGIPAFYGNTSGEYTSRVSIFYTGASSVKFGDALATYTGESEVWYKIMLEDGVTLEEDKNAGTVTTLEDETYGLYSKNNADAKSAIYVSSDACSYTDSTGYYIFSHTSDKAFTMPESYVRVNAHSWGEDGKCTRTSCNMVDIEKAYANNALTVEGLEGRTYDSYPQILSKITWKSAGGDEKVLTAPVYGPKYGDNYGTYGFGGETPWQAGDYTVVYKNNAEAYPYKQGDTGFDATKAPQVTITGVGDYVGQITIYFTIGAGEMRLSDFVVCGTKAEIIYDGKGHPAWNKLAVEFKPDEGDRAQFSQLEDGDYITSCGRTTAYEWFGAEWSSPDRVEYSTDEWQTWIVEKEFGADIEHMYEVKDAGEYSFYIKVTNKSCGELISDKLTAKVSPRDLTSNGITFDDPGDVIAYFTGKPVIPTAWDDKLKDSGLGADSNPLPAYTLVRNRDFIITAVDNTDISTVGVTGASDKLAKATITGTGNYKGELSASFQIKPAFTLKQTTISTEMWYGNNYIPFYGVDGGVPVVFSEYNYSRSNVIIISSYMRYIVYRASKEEGAGLGENVEFYTSLEDAVAGTNKGYAFSQEGVHTQTLYGKDPVTGYISEPVDVTLKIDVTAPVWEDENGNTEGFGIQIQGKWYGSLLNTAGTGLNLNTTPSIKIKASDNNQGVNAVSGITQQIAHYYYYAQEIDDTAAEGEVALKTREELDSIEKGTVYSATEGFVILSVVNGEARLSNTDSANCLKKDGKYILYACVEDNAGNMSDYVSTDIIVVDTQAPVMTVTEPKKEDGTLKDTEAELKVNMSEDATLMWFFISEGDVESGDTYDDSKADIKKYLTGDSAKYLPFATQQNGRWEVNNSDGWNYNEAAGLNYTMSWIKDNTAGTLSQTHTNYAAVFKINGTKGDNTIKIGDLGQPELFYPLYPSKKTAVWIAAIDAAGNITVLSDPVEFTTTKAIPKITTLPELSGVYGDTFADLTVKPGVAEYGGTVIDGTWSITQTGNNVLQVDDTTQCEVTFKPDTKYNDTYEETAVLVTPTIAPRQVIIKTAYMHKIYGEPCPGTDKLDFEIDESTPLAADDTKETIKRDLVVEIPVAAAGTDSECGEYRINFRLDNKNYNVTEWKCYEKLTDTDTVDYCMLVIERAAGTINTLSEFNAIQNVSYRYDGDYEAFNLGAEAGHNEAALSYEVCDARKANGDAITDAAEIADKLLSVSEDGRVTLKGAGSAKIIITLPESKNYTAAAPLTVEVNIAKADITIPEYTFKSIYSFSGISTYKMISQNGLNEKRLGTVIYGDGSDDNKNVIVGMTIRIDGTAVDNAKAKEEFFDKLPYVGGSDDVTCIIKEFDSYVPKTATVTIPVETENCTINGGAGIVFNLQVVDKYTVQPKSEVEAERALTYGEALSNIGFEKVTFVDINNGNRAVEGALEWEIPDAVLAIGTHQVKYIFKPKQSEYYEQYEGYVTVTVNKAKAKLTKAPVTDTYIYNPSVVADEEILNAKAKEQGFVEGLSGSRITGVWHFTDSAVTTKPLKAGSISYEIYFTPDEAAEAIYDCSNIKTTITITVNKAIPYIGTQPANTYTHGDYLYNQEPAGAAIYGNGIGEAGTGVQADAAVAGTFTWKTPSTRLTYLGNKSFDYIFTPEDTDSYEAVTGSVTVTVCKAANAPLMPEGEIKVEYSCETVGSASLPQGWKWSDADAAKMLKAGETVTVTALYDGEDKGSYVNETAKIRITRANCEHTRTEIRGAVKAACSIEGNTGATWCLVCGDKISDGVIIPKDAANHTALVSKVLRRATTEQEGIISYSCSDCGYYEEKTIARIPDEEDDDESSDTDSSNSLKPKPAASDTASPNKPSDNAGKQEKPYIRGENGKEGWDAIREELEVCAEGNTIVIDMNGSSVVPGNIFDAIKGKDITVQFDIGDGISWYVNGSSVQKDKTGDIDLGVTLGDKAADTIPVDIINAVTGERYSMNLTLAYDGSFGFEAVLRANLGAENKGLAANLFYYNKSTGELEFISCGEIDKNGYAELVFTHASDYVIVLDKASTEEKETVTDAVDTVDISIDADALTPKENTGASDKSMGEALIWIIVAAVIAAVAVVSIVVVRMRRKDN